MPDDKRGRERKGLNKRDQRLSHHIEAELDADETPPESPDESEALDLSAQLGVDVEEEKPD